MKKHFILAAMAMTALFSACSNEDPINEEKTTGQEVTFTIGGVNSRTTTSTSDFSTQFVDGDKVGIFSSGLAGTQMDNTSYTVGENGTKLTLTTSGTKYVYDGTNEATFYAYYPIQDTYTADSKEVNFTISTNQETDGIETSDFMTASATSNAASVELQFQHNLVLVQLDLSQIENVYSAVMKDIYTSITFNAANNSTISNTADGDPVSDIIMKDIDGEESGQIYWAIVPHQDIAEGKTLFTIQTTDNKTYSYKATSNTTLTSGSIAKYKLKIKESTPEVEETELTEFTSLRIVAWNGAETDPIEEGGFVKDLFTLTDIMPQSGTTLNKNTSNFLNSTTAGGWVYNGGKRIEAQGNGEKSCILMELASDAYTGDWYRFGIAYMGNDLRLEVGKKYELSFSMQSNTAGTSVHAFVGYASNGNKISKVGDFSDESSLKGSSYKTCTIQAADTWEEQSLIIDPSYYGTALISNNTLTAQTESSVQFSICIKPNITTAPTEDITIWITDVKLIEIE